MVNWIFSLVGHFFLNLSMYEGINELKQQQKNSYICHHVNKILIAAIKASLPWLALFLQLFHFLGHLHNNNKKNHVMLQTIKVSSKNSCNWASVGL